MGETDDLTVCHVDADQPFREACLVRLYHHQPVSREVCLAACEWLRVGDAWMVRVFDRDGKWIDGSVQEDMETAILAVVDSLLPKSD
jgi:hypothetical protein